MGFAYYSDRNAIQQDYEQRPSMSSRPQKDGAHASANLSERSLARVHPTEVVMAITGRDGVAMGGFVVEKKPMEWLRLDRQFADPHASPLVSETLDRRRLQAKATFLWSSVAAMVLAAAALGAYLGSKHLSPPYEINPQATSPVLWQVAELRADGIVLDVQGATVHIAVGQTMPNGETLKAVTPGQALYFTDRSTVSVPALLPAPGGAGQILGTATTPILTNTNPQGSAP